MSRRRKRVRERGSKRAMQQRAKDLATQAAIDQTKDASDWPASSRSSYGGSANYKNDPWHKDRCLQVHWRNRVELEDGVAVYASSWFDKPYTTEAMNKLSTVVPDIGFYLDAQWQANKLLTSPGVALPFVRQVPESTKTILYPWSDWMAPENMREFGRVVRWLLESAIEGKIVDIGCLGGHGRTGTTLAAMLIVQGMEARAAINKIRAEYCDSAIEGQAQPKFLYGLDHAINGRKIPLYSPSPPARDAPRRAWDSKKGEWVPWNEAAAAAQALQQALKPEEGLDRRDIIKKALSQSTGLSPQARQDAITLIEEYALSESEAEEIIQLIRAESNGVADQDEAMREPNSDVPSFDEYDTWEERNSLQYLNNAQCEYPPCKMPTVCDADAGECHSKMVAEEVAKYKQKGGV